MFKQPKNKSIFSYEKSIRAINEFQNNYRDKSYDFAHEHMIKKTVFYYAIYFDTNKIYNFKSKLRLNMVLKRAIRLY